MESNNRYDGLDPAAVSILRYHSKRLAHRKAVPGMDAEDYEQHLALHLVRRSKTYDKGRASYATFADRVIRSQAATLARPTEARSWERQMVSLDEIVPDGEDDSARALHDVIMQDGAANDAADLRVDLFRFLDSLPPALHRCLAWIADGGAQAAVREGLHRSSFYDARDRLRARALTHGLAEYLPGTPTFSAAGR